MSRNTVLFMTTIGTSRSSVAYLIEVLVTIARDLDTQISDSSPVERAAHERAVLRLTAPSAPLPDFSGFPRRSRLPRLHRQGAGDRSRGPPPAAARSRITAEGRPLNAAGGLLERHVTIAAGRK